MGNCLGRCLSGKNGIRYSTDDLESELVSEDKSGSGEGIIFKIMKFKRKKRPQFLDQFWEHKDLTYSRLTQINPVESSDIQLQCLDVQNLLVTSRDTQCTRFPTNQTDNGVVASSSRASSSLDLEWEHEYSNTNQLSRSWIFLPDEIITNGQTEEDDGNDTDKQSELAGSRILLVRQASNVQSTNNGQRIAAGTSSRTSWSHISTPESLEWDIDEEQQKQLHVEDDNLDHETLELLHEIEALKNKVLHETGDGLGMDLVSNGNS